METVGGYTLLGEIASGGVATIYLGRRAGSLGFARTVVVKRLHSHHLRDTEHVAMLIDEARLASRISHPNVVSMLDVVVSSSEVLLVIDYVEGASLARVLAAQPTTEKMRVPLDIASAIVADVLRGLHAAHEAVDERGRPLELVHRGICPQSILIGVDGLARVIDFGIAKATGRLQVTRDGVIKGKLAYMAPEQVQREPVSRRSDIYSLGVVLWELLTGERLFIARGAEDVMKQVLSGAIPPPSARHAPAAPLDDVVRRATALSSGDRFHSAAEMLDAIEQAVVPAPPWKVAAWLAEVGKVPLAKNAQQVASLLSTLPASSDAIPADLLAWRAAWRRRKIGRVLMAAVAVLGALGVFALLASRNERPPRRLQTEPVPPTAMASAPAAESARAPTTGAVAPSASSLAIPVATRPASGAPLATAGAASTRPSWSHGQQPDCRAPFTVDSTGKKVYRRECLPR